MREPWWTNAGQFRAFPRMAIEHAEMVRKAIPDHPCVVTEWGMGGSTLWFLQILPPGSTLFAFDHDKRWFTMVFNAYRKMFDAGLIDASIIFYPERIPALDPLPSVLRSAHVMLVDCKHEWRAPVLDMVHDKKLLLPNGDVFMHDAEVPEYQDAIARFTAGNKRIQFHPYADSKGVEMWHGRRRD